jgi:hypothetical protein
MAVPVTIALDLAAGRHWIDRVVAELRRQRIAELRPRHRAAWLRRRERGDEEPSQ